MLPNVLRTDAADHVPVLAEEVRGLLDVQRERSSSMPPSARVGIRGSSSPTSRGRGKLIAIDRDPTVRPYFDRMKASVRGVQTRFLRGDYAVVLSQLAGNGVQADASSSTSGSRRCRSTVPSAGSRTRRTRRSTCGWTRRTSPTRPRIVNTWDARELEVIFRRYGEERYARQIARGIVRRREEAPIERTGQLVDVVRASIPAPARFGEGHPAKRVFQALRIEVNHELQSLEAGLPPRSRCSCPGGRLAVMSFHSLGTASRSASCATRRAARARPSCRSACVGTSRSSASHAEAGPSRRRGDGVEPASRVRPPAGGGGEGVGHVVRRASREDEVSRSRTSTRSRPRPRILAGGVVWIVFFAVLLAGVVAVNVSVLRLNIQLDQVGRERSELKGDIAGLRSGLSSASATARIERIAEKELGLQQADPDTTTYLRLPR